eukprot:2103383-Rhodomonas_salina.1
MSGCVCADGYYHVVPRASAGVLPLCGACPSGYYCVNDGELRTCAGSGLAGRGIVVTGASSAGACVCFDGTYSLSGGGACVACDVGFFCRGGLRFSCGALGTTLSAGSSSSLECVCSAGSVTGAAIAAHPFIVNSSMFGDDGSVVFRANVSSGGVGVFEVLSSGVEYAVSFVDGGSLELVGYLVIGGGGAGGFYGGGGGGAG